jgi:hypothetical protein
VEVRAVPNRCQTEQCGKAFWDAEQGHLHLTRIFGTLSMDYDWTQLNISGTPVPVIMRYLILHEKGAPVAIALPQLWQSL